MIIPWSTLEASYTHDTHSTGVTRNFDNFTSNKLTATILHLPNSFRLGQLEAFFLSKISQRHGFLVSVPYRSYAW